MARPTKKGVDYFPLDVDFDNSIELFLADVGASGFGILIATWQLIYKENGYYIDYSDDLFLLIRRRLLAEINEIKMVIDKAVIREIFDPKKLQDFGILTSTGIQKRYLIAAKKKKTLSINDQFMINEGLRGINYSKSGINYSKSCGNATKEEEEVKGEGKRKLKPNGKFAPPSLAEIKKYIEEKKYSVDANSFFNFYESKNWMVGKNKMSKWRSAVAQWQSRSKPKPENETRTWE